MDAAPTSWDIVYAFVGACWSRLRPFFVVLASRVVAKGLHVSVCAYVTLSFCASKPSLGRNTPPRHRTIWLVVRMSGPGVFLVFSCSAFSRLISVPPTHRNCALPLSRLIATRRVKDARLLLFLAVFSQVLRISRAQHRRRFFMQLGTPIPIGCIITRFRSHRPTTRSGHGTGLSRHGTVRLWP